MDNNNNMRIIQTIEQAIVDLGSAINKLERAHLELSAENALNEQSSGGKMLAMIRQGGDA